MVETARRRLPPDPFGPPACAGCLRIRPARSARSMPSGRVAVLGVKLPRSRLPFQSSCQGERTCSLEHHCRWSISAPGLSVIRDYAQAAEALGYSYLVAPDHVLGVNPAADHAGRRVGTTANPYHDPFVLFGFLAGCTQRIGFAVGVLILAQRQAVLVAKQAA